MKFAHGSSAVSGTGFTYDSVGVTVGAKFLLIYMVSLTYNYLYSSNTDSSQGESIFSKNMVLLGLCLRLRTNPL